MEQQHLAPYDMEWMKMAMQKHEEVFKQQVYELHRLYRLQKMLMKNTSIGHQGAIPTTDHPRRNHKHPRPYEDCFNRKQARMLDHFDQDNEAIDLTLGLGTYNYHSEKSSKKLSPTRLTSDSVMSFSSSSTGSNSHLRKKASAVRRNNDEVYQEQYYQRQDQAMEQPQWLLQALGLNI